MTPSGYVMRRTISGFEIGAVGVLEFKQHLGAFIIEKTSFTHSYAWLGQMRWGDVYLWFFDAFIIRKYEEYDN